MGTGQFAALCLEGLVKRSLTFTRIITGQPTRSGRNKTLPSHVEIKALELGLSVTRTGKLTENQELIDALESSRPDIIFVIDFGQIIKPPFLDCMCLNIHPSLLPEYRGAAPIQRALLDGRDKTGVTVFRLVQAMDAGGILASREIAILPEHNASDLYRILSEAGCEIAVENIRDNMTFTPQDDSLATFAGKLDKEDFAVTFSMSAEKIFHTVRALDMSGGAYVIVNDKRVKLWRVRPCDVHDKSGISGRVLESGKSLVISCGDGNAVELLDVQNEGKSRLTGIEWARGQRLKQGDIL